MCCMFWVHVEVCALMLVLQLSVRVHVLLVHIRFATHTQACGICMDTNTCNGCVCGGGACAWMCVGACGRV